MALLNVYKPYLYDNLTDSEKKKAGVDIFGTLTIKVLEMGIDSADVYLGAFTKGSIGFVDELFKLNDFYNEGVYGKETTFSTDVLENIVAGFALNNLWKEIKKVYPTDEKLKEALIGKEDMLNVNLGYFEDNLNTDKVAELEGYVSLLQPYGVNVSLVDLNSDLKSYFKNLESFLGILSVTQEELTEEKRRKKIISASGGARTKFVDDLSGMLVALYETGFTGFPQEGILLRNDSTEDLVSPILRVRQGKVVSKSVKNDIGLDNDIRIEIALSKRFNEFSDLYPLAKEDELLPNIEYFLSKLDNREPFVCPALHLAFQTADSRYTKGKISIRKWVKETQGGMSFDEWKSSKNGNSDVIKNWDTVKKWYKWSLETIFTDALMEYNRNGVKLVGNPREELEVYKKVGEALKNGISNVIVVSERDNKKFSKIELRIACKDAGYPEIKEVLDSEFDVTGSEKMNIENIKTPSSMVTCVRLIYDKKEANKGALFAGDVIDSFLEAGQMPSWSHALIGKKEDGSLFFWDGFMDPKKAGPMDRCYTIYAGSRSGKGIMTSTLVASALADGKQVFYTDGKPENGPSLGMIAWEKGREAYVFDGQKSGQAPFAGDMENYTQFNGKPLRNSYDKLKSIKTDLNKIPDLFEKTFSSDDVKVYLGVMRYLKSLMLCVEIMEARASSILPMDNWQIWIFDEMTSMSANEKTVREKFASYCSKRGIQFSNGAKKGQTAVLAALSLSQIKNPNIINPDSMSFDPGIKFIYDWCAWTEALMKKIVKANVISLGKSNTNLIFIFQEPTWIPKDSTSTTIAKIVSLIQSTKIAGRGGIQDGCGVYGDGTIKDDWKRKINIEGAGNWAMSTGADIRTSGVVLFKPFNIYTVPNQSNALDRKVPDGVPATNYLAGYTDKLLGHFGKDTAEVIESAYTYADEAVKTLGLVGQNETVQDYIYNAGNLSFNDAADLDSIFAEAVSGMEELGFEVSDDVKEKTGGATPFSVSSEDDLPIEVGENQGNENPLEQGGSSNTENNNSGSQTTESGSNENRDPVDNMPDPRLLAAYEALDPEYTKIINKIEGKKDTLLNIPRKDTQLPKFNNLKNEILRNFNGEYAIDKNKFFEKVRRTVTDAKLYGIISSEYGNRFTTDFERLKQEVSTMEFVVEAEPDTNTGGSSETGDMGGGAAGGAAGGTTENKPVTTEEHRPPNEKSKLNGRSISSDLGEQSEGLVYNVDNTDSWDNVKASSHLTQIVIKDIKKQFGGINGIESIGITANGCLVINEYTYSPAFSESFMNSLGTAIRQDVENGQIYKVVNIGRVINSISTNIYELSIETPKVACNDVFKKEMGIKGDNYGVLFKTHNNLQTIYLPDEELTRNNPNQQQSSGGGLGSKLARIFGFGGNRNSGNYTPNPAPSYEGNDMVDRIFDSKPVRVLTGALGWTLGCKAVVMAATIFGPWGLLFGAFAAVGAYNSMKEDRNNYSSNNRNNGSNGNYRNNSGNGSNGGNKGKNGSQGKNNKNKWN